MYLALVHLLLIMSNLNPHRAEEVENCSFPDMVQKHVIRMGPGGGPGSSSSGSSNSRAYLPNDDLYNAIVTNIISNLVISSCLFVAFALLFTRLGKRVPLWGSVANWLHDITCRADNEEQLQQADLRNLPLLTKLGRILWLDTAFLVSTCGRDAAYFLVFQRHLCGFTLIITLLVMTTTLPVHQFSGKDDNLASFQSTSLRNITSDSVGVLINILVGAAYLPIGVFMMRKFSSKLHYLSSKEMSRVGRTLVLYGLPPKLRSIESIRRWIAEYFPGFRIRSINLCVKWGKMDGLAYLYGYYKTVLRQCFDHCGCLQRKKVWRLPYLGILLFWWKSDTVGHVYYREELEKVRAQMKLIFTDIGEGKGTLDTAFVTMQTVNEAVGMFTFQNLRRRSDKSVMVRYAKAADSIRWKNITRFNYFTCVHLFHWFLLAVLVFLFSSPQFIQRQARKISFHELFESFLESLFYFAVTNLVPIIVLRSTEFLGYWSETKINVELLIKAYICLLTILFVIPMLNPDNLLHVFKIYLREARFDYDFRCLFLPDNGVFFFNNLITFSLVGNCIRLCRFSHLVWHFMAFLTSRTACEAKTVSRFMQREHYWIGERTAWNLVHLTIMIGLSLSCPLIMLAGTVYFWLTHGVDTFLLYKRYYDVPAVETRSYYRKCITVVLFTTWIVQVSISVFLISRTKAVTSLLALSLSLILAMPSALLISYQHSMRHEGPIQIFRAVKFGAIWKREARKEAGGPYHPPKVLKDVDFPTSNIQYSEEI